ncbi:MAG: hypothetical protein IJV45_02375 [Prevotella sp.]|nr:hypothetical protein [Prevotella sp.]
MKYLLISATVGCALSAGGQSLDERHLLLDGSLSATEAASRPFVYRSLQELVAHLQDTTTVYVAPWVYWVDDPDHPEVVVGRDGREPFGMEITAKKLDFIGISSNARDAVFASKRGQTQGAVGNFTMFFFHVDELRVENLTMGNFCNVDLDYKLRPELSIRKRSDVITQAHVGYVDGRRLVARNVRFISRLNLNPLNGAGESLYENCHFECTDDALNGRNAIYRHCDFDLYGAKPLWSTSERGVLFDDCDFYVRTNNRETYFCKQGGPVAVNGCRYHAPEGSVVGWTAYPQPWLRCYQQDFTLNGRPYLIGQAQPSNTVSWHEPADSIPFLAISRHEARLRSPAELTLQSEPGVSWSIDKNFDGTADFKDLGRGEILGKMINNSDETVDFCIVAKAADGREAACHVQLEPSLLPPPSFIREPHIVIDGDSARLDYELDLHGLRDESIISWLRNGIMVSTSHDRPQRTYHLTEADRGHRLTATIMPKSQRSEVDKNLTTMESSIFLDFGKFLVNSFSSFFTDFSNFPTQWQPLVKPGFWIVDGYKPEDTADYDWTFDPKKPMWAYAEGFNGAVGRGLVQAQRGARLMYTPVNNSCDHMSLQLDVDPTKTAGQGFGSATGQYMDVCLKFDTRTLTGYGLRIVRTTKHAKAVDFLLVEYADGKVSSLTDPVTATCYRTGCTIRLEYRKGHLTADVTTTTPHPADSQLPHEVHLKAKVRRSSHGGIHIQHTGTCGESTTMLHRLKVEW